MSTMLTRAEFDAEMAERDRQSAGWQRRMDADMQSLRHRTDRSTMLWEGIFTESQARLDAQLELLRLAMRATAGALRGTP